MFKFQFTIAGMSDRNLAAPFLMAAILILGDALSLEAQDVLVTRKPGSQKTAKRKGEIIEWKGLSITIHSTGRDRNIDNDEIVEVQTKWSESFTSANIELRQGRTRIAIEQYEKAVADETRSWAKRIIRAKLVDAYQSIEQPARAINHFLEIIEEDPQTRFMHLAPLPWAGSSNALVQQSATWLNSKQPAIQLIGASWSLGGSNRDDAIKVLNELSADIDPRVRNLAIGQLWRIRTNVSERQTEVWQGLVDRMPRELRAGPTFVLANAQARCQKADEALINLMRIPILYPSQRSLAAAALYRSANMLQNSGKTNQSKSLLNELVSKYPETIWAQQATNN